jgi:diaminohydroxyphosphoribosylaminopyrimidine deaminase/5-amino-6-(5-phosphoribosylamino)uracil reductase
MGIDEKYMQRCIELAKLGINNAAPNPMVGCVIVCEGKIIGEGYHKKYGAPHAEVNAINSINNQELLKTCTLYVSLEPCSHFGKTPPCSDLIISKKIPRVVIGTIDPFAKVAGKGIEKLQQAGINVNIGIREDECLELNKRFFTFHKKHRPYIILKWAQTLDGFIDINRDANQFGKPTWITGKLARRFVHKTRAEEDGLMIGTKTALKDNPSLTVYNWNGNNPIRIVIDKNLRLPKNLKLFDNSANTLIFNSKKTGLFENSNFITIDFNKNIIPQIIEKLVELEIQSLIIEGGKQLLESFIDQNFWDETQLFIGNKFFHKGVRAPEIQGEIISETTFDSDLLKIIKNYPQV